MQKMVMNSTGAGNNRSFGVLVDHPVLVFIFLLLISTIASIGYVAPTLLVDQESDAAPAAQNKNSEGKGKRQRLPDVQAAQLARFDAVLLAESKNLFTASSASTLRYVVKRLEQADQIKNVNWMDRSVPLNVFGLREPVFPNSSASQIRFDAARDKALANPMIGGFMLSDDATTTMLMMQIDWFHVVDDEDCTTRIREIAEQAAADFGNNDLSFKLTGRIPIEMALRARNEHNERKYQIIANCFTLVMAIILFRGIVAVVVVALAPGIGVFWTLGLLNFFDLQDNPFNHIILPILISLVGFTDGVHMMVQIRANRAAGHPPKEATRIALKEVGLACFLTSLTTAIGFGSLSLAQHEVVREFGWCCVLGVTVTFFSVVTVIPLLCMTPLGQRVHAGHSKGLVDQHFGRAVWLVDWVLERYRLVSAIGLVSLLSLAGISGLLRPDERKTSVLPDTGEELVALRLMDQKFGGLETAKIAITWEGEEPETSNEFLKVTQQAESILHNEAMIGHPISVASLIDAMPGDGEIEERASMIELLPPPLKRAFYVPERNRSEVLFRVQDLGIAKYGPVFQRVETKLKALEVEHPQFQLKLEGDAIWRWKNLYQIVVDLVLSLGTAILVIFCVLSIVYRSIRIGLLSLVPNVFPLAATGTALVIWGQSLEIVSVCAFTVCLGIAVDDTIHFLTRFNEERMKTKDTSEAIRRSFIAVGTALIMTTIVLIAGFGTALSSDTVAHIIFATMGILTIGSALFADLILLPALLKLSIPETADTTPSQDNPNT